jgi:hypothetical protein
MRAPDGFTGPPNTCDSGVFTATATSLLIGRPEGVPRSLGQPRAWCVKAMRHCRPIWPVCRQETSPGWYGRFMGIPTVMVAVKAVSWNLMNRRENLSDFRMFVMAGALSASRARHLTQKPRRLWTGGLARLGPSGARKASEPRRQGGQPLWRDLEQAGFNRPVDAAHDRDPYQDEKGAETRLQSLANRQQVLAPANQELA